MLEVRRCPSKSCSLYPFRLGKNPYRSRREYTPEQREALKARLSKNLTNTVVENTSGIITESQWIAAVNLAPNAGKLAEI